MTIDKCPDCGCNVVVTLDKPDGYYMGYSVSCIAYKDNDKKHKKKRAFFGFDSAEQAIRKWERETE